MAEQHTPRTAKGLCGVAINAVANFAAAVRPRPQHTDTPSADNAKIFRHMDRCAYRRVLEDSGGRRRVKVAHEASWRFLLLHGKFTTK